MKNIHLSPEQIEQYHEQGYLLLGKVLTDAQVAEIAQAKLPDLNTDDLEQAKLQVAGTARSMGIQVT